MSGAMAFLAGQLPGILLAGWLGQRRGRKQGLAEARRLDRALIRKSREDYRP